MFSFTGLANVNRTDTVNGLNQVTATGGTSVSHDARGNISAIGTAAYGYSSENLLVSAPNNVTFSYDPLRRLDLVSSPAGATRFLYDGDQLIAEYDAGGSLLRRFVHGPGIDEPLVWYEGSGTSDRRWSHADERGSVVEHSDGGADIIGTPNRYDEYGAPQGALTGRFGYTGQAWLPEAGLYYYRARMYNPTLGRFMQTDPIGYGGGMNLYAYVGNDPLNRSDPSGLDGIEVNAWPLVRLINSNLESMWRRGALNRNIGSSPMDRAVECNTLGCREEQEITATGTRPPSATVILAANQWSGPSFCQPSRLGRPNFFNPLGRIVSGRIGSFDDALGDLDRLARINGISPLGDEGAAQVLAGQMGASWYPWPVGDGWWVTRNFLSGDISVMNWGLTFRLNPPINKINIDIPRGFLLPSGMRLPMNETCHYTAP